MKKLKNIPSLTLPVLALVVIAILLLIFESDFLWKLQEENLFLNSKIFFKEQMVEPGGFLTWISTWFTQFLFHPWMGVLMLCGWWLLLMWLVKRAFRVRLWWMPITVIPVLFLLVTIVDMGYWVYILKLRGHVFLGTIGTTAAIALLWAFRVLNERIKLQSTKGTWLKPLLLSLFVVLTCAAGYSLMGIYGLGATLLMAVWIWRLESHYLSALAVSLTGLLSVWLMPLFFYRFVYYQINVENIYVAKLPLYYVLEEYASYYLPFVLLLGFFVVMCLVPNRPYTPAPSPSLNVEKKKVPKQKQQAGKGKVKSPLHYGEMLIAGLLLLAAAVYTYSEWYKDKNFHCELAMQRCIDRLDWEGVLDEAMKLEKAMEPDDTPTRAIVVMRNLALAHLNRQGNEMYHYKNGCKKCNAPFDVRAINSVGPLIYYHYGMPNYSYRLCMERGVEFGWRAEQLKYMVRCSILNGEMKLARKYINLLRQTMYHDKWADEMYQLTEHPENIVKNPEMEFITHMMHFENKLTADHNLVENFLLKCLAHSNYTADPIFLQQVLYASMEMKDASLFLPHLHNYSMLYPDSIWPVHLQEAAYLFFIQKGTPNMDRFPVSNAVKENYARFDAMAPRYTFEEAKEALYPIFGNTYFYRYDLVNFPPQN